MLLRFVTVGGIKMRKLLLALWLISIFILGAREASSQCKCAANVPGSKYLTPHDALKTSDAVFIGEVVEVNKVETSSPRKREKSYEYEVKFKVKRAWKKELEQITTLRTGHDDGCIIRFEEGEEVLVYAYVREKMLRTGACTKTKLLSQAAEDLKDFEEKGEKSVKIIETLLPKE
jgi:hypothetical protein